MDTADRQLHAELDRRLALIAGQESDDPARAPLPAADLWALLALVVVLTLLGFLLVAL